VKIKMIFIISWSGQHENACRIANQIEKNGNKACIVYSDPDTHFVLSTDSQVIRRPNDLFWADKFKACLDAVGSEGMLVIHADCQCNDWSKLVDRCQDVVDKYKDIGVWAPKISGTYWHVNATKIVKLNNSDLVFSAMTDGIVFYLAPVIIDRMRRVDYTSSKFGWGIDALFCSYAHTFNKMVVIDLMINVEHPREKTGYDMNKAKKGQEIFLKNFTFHERIKYELLLSHVRYNYVKMKELKEKIKKSIENKVNNI
jgi:hypothetical protein